MKSLTFQPDPIDKPTLPCEILSTTAQSSTARITLWRGRTRLPARISIRVVETARADARTAGFGDMPPKGSKCLSGTEMNARPNSSARLAILNIVSYCSAGRGCDTPKSSIPNLIEDGRCSKTELGDPEMSVLSAGGGC